MMGTTHRLLGTGVATVGGTLLGLSLDDLTVLATGACASSSGPDNREHLAVYYPWLRRRRPIIKRKGWRIFRHRGLTHWPETWAALSVAGVLAASVYLGHLGVLAATGLSLGWLLHLMADALTPHGLEVRSLGKERRYGETRVRRVWLLPDSARITTDSRTEAAFCVLCVIGLAGFLWLAYRPQLTALA